MFKQTQIDDIRKISCSVSRRYTFSPKWDFPRTKCH